jgi:phenylacetate-CoA ligase
LSFRSFFLRYTHRESHLQIIALGIYGLAELGGPGVAGERHCKCGLHIAKDHFIAEVVDPESGKILADQSGG